MGKPLVGEVVEEQVQGLVISKMQPGIEVVANFEDVRAKINAIAADFQGAELGAGYTLKEAKRDRAYLNSLSTSLVQRYREVKREYMAPVEVLDAKIKELDAPIKEASSALDIQIKRLEEAAKTQKRAEIKAHYEDFAPALVQAVPFERIEDSQWLLASFSPVKAKEAIESTVERIAREEATLDELGLAHLADAKAEYFATLDLSRAIARSKEIDEQLAKAARVAEDKAANERWMAEQAAAKASAVDMLDDVITDLIGPDVAPELLCARCLLVAVAVEGVMCDGCRADVEVLADPVPAPREYTFTLTCTRDQLSEILAHVKAMGLHGRCTASGTDD